jgi:RNA polymerase sigma-70 factor (ECF subfamily)
LGPSLRDTFVQYQDELLGTLFHLLGNADDARDAFQEAFLKCWSRRQELESIQSLKAWVFRVAINTARDLRQTAYRRHRKGLEAIASNEPIAQEPTPAERMLASEDVDRARQAIGKLRDEEKEVFLLRENGELTYEEIALQLQIPVGTVKTRMRSALARLRSALSIDEKGGD